jgi:hypothetical protein
VTHGCTMAFAAAAAMSLAGLPVTAFAVTGGKRDLVEGGTAPVHRG